MISPPRASVSRTPRPSIRWQVELLLQWALHRVNLRYKETLLGFGWIFLQPVALTMIFNYIRRVADIPTGNIPYPLFVAVGLVPWSFTSLAISQSTMCVSGNESILKRIALPKILIPLSVILSAMADLAVMALLLVGLFLYYGHPLAVTALWLPVIVAVHLCLLVGLACILSLANVYLRDVGHAVPHLIWLWFFGSPVFYPARMVPSEFQTLARWNPMAGLIESYRTVLLQGQPPAWEWLGPAVLVSLAILGLGLLLFQSVEGTLVDML